MEATVVPTEVTVLEVIVVERRVVRPSPVLVEIDEEAFLATAGWLDSHTRELLIKTRVSP